MDASSASTPAQLLDRANAMWVRHFGDQGPSVAAFAPGRVEILGNHTDYNDGWALAAAIDRGMVFLAAPADGTECRLYAGDLAEETSFDARAIAPSETCSWSNYVRGMLHWLQARHGACKGIRAVFTGNIPLGAGLSSSAALEMAAGLALARLHGVSVPPLELAKAGQAAEHEFAGARCGLLDQLAVLHGRRHGLVLIDFRTLAVRSVPLHQNLRLLIADTRVQHALIDGAYNERRTACEEAARNFARVVSRPVHALRDVTWQDWTAHASAFDSVTMRRAAHVIGENQRVLDGVSMLEQGDTSGFGRLMFDSHASSMKHFENSCPEQDFLVATARNLPGILGARLSGGGFGGSVVALAKADKAKQAGQALASAYAQEYGKPCPILIAEPAAGALEVALR